jgi:hypothetical protein
MAVGISPKLAAPRQLVMARTSKAHAAPEPDLKIVLPEAEGMTTPPTPDPFVIGPASPAGTPGFYMGIGTRPQTPAEHNTRLGASAGKFNDAGFLLGNLAPRVGWPMGDVPAQLP